MGDGPKHLQLIVPNYDQSGENPRSPLTYFRMGADFQDDDEFPPLASRGNELLAGMQFKDDHRTPTKPGKRYVKETAAALVDGDVAYRTALTAELVTRGGWREHTDGNRISTTRGDCVEVVRGNYKLVVLGRIADHWQEPTNPNVGHSWLESSGGHNHASTSTPGAVQTINWTEHEDGTWRVKEQTDKGNVLSYFLGRNEEHYFGPSIISTVGCGAPGVPEKLPILGEGAAPPHPAALPDIESETHACSITTQDTVDDHTSTTVADSISDKTHIATKKTSVKTSAGRYESTTYVGALNESLFADTVKESYNFGTRTAYTFGGVEASFSFVGFHHHKRKLTKVAFTLAGATVAIDVAATASLSIGAFTSVKLATKTELGKTLLSVSFALAKLEVTVVETDVFLLEEDNKATEIASSVNDQTMFMSETIN